MSLESNGKRVTRDGMPLQWTSAPGLVGRHREPIRSIRSSSGCTRGRIAVPVEFVVPVRARQPIGNQQTLLVANALAQAQALLVGRSAEQLLRELVGQGLAAHEVDRLVAARVCPGNRGSTTLLLPVVDAWQLGALLALYEHRTYVESLLGR